MKSFVKHIFTILFLFAIPLGVFASGEVSLSEQDIVILKQNIVTGDTVRIYARIFNKGDSDVLGNVALFANDTTISLPQLISIRPNTYDDIFVDWKPITGNYTISAKIVALDVDGKTIESSTAIEKSVLVDSDTDNDGIGDTQDDDIDGDGVLNEAQKTEEQRPSAKDENAKTSGFVSTAVEKYNSVYEQIQRGIEKFYELPLTQNIAEYVGKAVGGKAKELYTGAVANIQTTSNDDSNDAVDLNYQKKPEGFWEKVLHYFALYSPHSYIGAGFMLILICWIIFRAFRGKE